MIGAWFVLIGYLAAFEKWPELCLAKILSPDLFSQADRRWGLPRLSARPLALLLALLLLAQAMVQIVIGIGLLLALGHIGAGVVLERLLQHPLLPLLLFRTQPFAILRHGLPLALLLQAHGGNDAGKGIVPRACVEAGGRCGGARQWLRWN